MIKYTTYEAIFTRTDIYIYIYIYIKGTASAKMVRIWPFCFLIAFHQTLWQSEHYSCKNFFDSWILETHRYRGQSQPPPLLPVSHTRKVKF